MRRYLITITLSDGDKIEARSVGNTEDEALQRVLSNKLFVDFASGREIVGKNIRTEGIVQPVNPENYIIRESERHGHYVVTDKVNNVVVIFAKGRYNDTARITPLYDLPQSAVDTATILREIGEYLAEYHKDKI